MADVADLRLRGVSVRFRCSSSPPPYLNRRAQARLLLFVGLLAGVMIAIQVAARPATWAWLFSDDAGPSGQSAASRQSRDVDFSVRFDGEARDPLAADEFLAQAPPAAEDGREAGGTGKETGRGRTGDVAIAPEILRSVQDDFVGLRAAEAEAYFHVLGRVRALDAGSLEQASAGLVDFAVLMDSPDRFRGRPVTVEGELKGLTPIPVAENAAGVEALWEGWVFNRDSWPNPWCVRAVEIPEGIPQGSRLSQSVRVRVTGYFFKKYGYASEGGFHKAPLLLARRIEWVRTPVAAATPAAGLGPWILGGAVAIALGLGVMVWRLKAGDRRFEETQRRRFSDAPRESIEALAGVETTELSNLFRRLADEDSSRPGAAVDGEHQGVPQTGA
jgi:hypothetical protein